MTATFLFHFHSGLRWVLALGVILALVRYLALWLTAKEFQSFDKTLTTVVTSLFDIQLLVGIILFFMLSNGFSALSGSHLEHGATMLLAAIAVHLPGRWKKSPAPIRAKAHVLALLIAAVLIIAGVARLPQGWQF
jgi:hypothetical protein